ncbi:MAG: hypothetical protein ABIF18_01435 [archaeon]
MKPKILYVEDERECYKKTLELFGEDFDFDWRRFNGEVLPRIYNKELLKYSAGVFDVNLFYEPHLPYNEQTKDGLILIKLAKQEAEKNRIKFPILCISERNEEEVALKAGADLFMFKKEFWDRGREVLGKLIKKK